MKHPEGPPPGLRALSNVRLGSRTPGYFSEFRGLGFRVPGFLGSLGLVWG